MGFRDLSKLLPIALKSLRNNPQHLETNFVPFRSKFSSFIYVANVAMKIRWPLFCYNNHHIFGQNSMIVSLSYPYMMDLSLIIRFICIIWPCSENLATRLVVLNFWRCIYLHTWPFWLEVMKLFHAELKLTWKLSCSLMLNCQHFFSSF